jgi:hypothetical protein
MMCSGWRLAIPSASVHCTSRSKVVDELPAALSRHESSRRRGAHRPRSNGADCGGPRAQNRWHCVRQAQLSGSLRASDARSSYCPPASVVLHAGIWIKKIRTARNEALASVDNLPDAGRECSCWKHWQDEPSCALLVGLAGPHQPS